MGQVLSYSHFTTEETEAPGGRQLSKVIVLVSGRARQASLPLAPNMALLGFNALQNLGNEAGLGGLLC